MTATDELRRLLDERGVKHYDGTENTLWGYEDYNEFTGIYRFSADETSDGRMQVRLWHATPAQVIEATLGRGTCEVEGSIDYGEFGCWQYDLSCGCRILWPDSEPPMFCPNCGRKVVE